MSHTYTTQDGKTARLVNPYENIGYHACRTEMMLYDAFIKDNPPIPLTTELPDLIGKEFQGEVVWQAKKPLVKKWYEIEEDEKDYLSKFGCSFRQAFKALSVPVKGEEKLPYTLHRLGDDQPKLSVEEAAEQFFFKDSKARCWPKATIEYVFISGHTHATNDANLVPLDKLLFNAFIKSLLDSGGYTITDLKAKEPELIKDVYDYWVNNLLDYTDVLPITQIKNLTKE